ncbi:MAG: hypothetical protein HKN04_06115 [Rhodothermaceae bacterium]|nr:hypothetical protein [Rhodothermaceae bacterium]
MAHWFLGTPLPEALSTEGPAVVAYLRADASTREKADRAFAFIYAVGEHSLTYHFQEPLEQLGVSVVLRRTVGVALGVALKGLRGPMRRVLQGMSEEQMLGVADELEFRLYPNPHSP